jgi:integrase
MRVTYNANRIDIPLPFWVDENFWDEKEERAKKGSYNKGITTKDINRAIDEYKNCINEVFAKYEYEKIIPPPRDALKLFNELAGRSRSNEEEKSKDIFIFFYEFLSEGSTYWTDGTYRRLKSTQKHLKEFNPILTFGELTKNKLSEYVLFLREKNDLRNSTLKKEFSLLVWFLNWAVEKKYCTNLEYQSFNPKLKIIKEKKVIFLTWKELMTLYSLEIPKSKNYLEKVRDVFCFCCFTSLRYSDVYNLKRTNITETIIDVITVKTSERIVIDLNKYSKSILV